MAYDLWYWPSIQGRGEFVRLALEAGEIAYRDRARDDGVEALIADMKAREGRSPYAPPYLTMDGICIAQTANILMFLGERQNLAPSSTADRLWLNQFQLTIADLVAEVHNVHHPVAVSAYYDEQKAEAKRAAEQFREERIPKYMGHFEAAVDCHPGDWLIDHRWTYVDTSLFQVVAGLRYMFPRWMRAIEADYPGVVRIHDQVTELPAIRTYLASERRLAFNTDGIFRHYPELDDE